MPPGACAPACPIERGESRATPSATPVIMLRIRDDPGLVDFIRAAREMECREPCVPSSAGLTWCLQHRRLQDWHLRDGCWAASAAHPVARPAAAHWAAADPSRLPA